MAMAATGQPPPGVVQPPLPSIQPNKLSSQTLQPKSYASILNPKESLRHIPFESIPAPTVEYHHSEPSFVWEDKDVEDMVISEELQYGVVGKFAYGMPDFHELKKQIPLQLELKGECCIGFLDSRHILIRLSILEDYVHVLSRPAFYIKVGHRLHQMRGLKYEVWFDPNEETSIGVAWISFPCLPPVFFGKETVFSLARAMGKPLQLDAATIAKSRPICAKVKVEIDLVAARPQRVRIGIKNSTTGETRFKWIRIRYDYVLKYCKECRLQGHCEEECYVLHHELEQKNEEPSSLNVEHVRILQSGKVVGNINKGDPIEVTQQVDRRKPTQEKNGDKLDHGQPTHVQGNQRRKGSRFLHPNRNPNAWVPLDTKKNQGKEAAQIEAVPTKNSFAILEREEVDSQELQCKPAATLIEGANVEAGGATMEVVNVEPAAMDRVQEESRLKEDNVAFVLEKDSDGNHTPIGTRTWAENSFRDHPKNQFVGEIIISGKDAMNVAKKDSQIGLKAGGIVHAAVAVSLDINVPSNEAAGRIDILSPRIEAAAVQKNPATGVEATHVGLKAKGLVDGVGIEDNEAGLTLINHVDQKLEGHNALNLSGEVVNADASKLGKDATFISDATCALLPKDQLLNVVGNKDLVPTTTSLRSAGSLNGGGDLTRTAPDGDSQDVNVNIKVGGIHFNDGLASTSMQVGGSLLNEFNAHGGELLRAAADLNEAVAASFLPVVILGVNNGEDSPIAIDDDRVSQGICVENKKANDIPSFEESSEEGSKSVATKYYGKDLIPTVLLERLCKSVSPNFGKPGLNINAPSFVPKSLMQIVPSSKKLPTDDELIKRMDFNDTRGILARQVKSIQEEPLHGNYFVEDDDMFEEEELDEESTTHNFSMVAREGDLSPRAIHDNAPKKVKRERRPLEPTRVQPSRSTKSKSIKSKKSKK